MTNHKKKVDTGEIGTCAFCNLELRENVIARLGKVIAIPDANPVTKGHLLIVTCRHTQDWFSMTPEEHQDANKLLQMLRSEILQSDPLIAGFNVGANCGTAAGQQIMHAHIHLIPRRHCEHTGITKIKGVIRNKFSY
jgi:ATP adenylyltransferase